MIRSAIGAVLHLKDFPDTGSPNTKYEYLHRDHLGSVEVVTDASGNELRVMAFDPFGERRKEDWSGHLTQAEIDTIIDEIRGSTSRGFTGQENLDRTGFVHLNGRVYDPTLGRFISADPIVQAPTYSASWNRYSYVMNSPMTFNDPSGYVAYDSSGICGGLALCHNYSGKTTMDSGGVGGGGARYGTKSTVTSVFARLLHRWVVRTYLGSGTSIFGRRWNPDDEIGFGGIVGFFNRELDLVITQTFDTSVTTTTRSVENSTESTETDEPITWIPSNARTDEPEIVDNQIEIQGLVNDPRDRERLRKARQSGADESAIWKNTQGTIITGSWGGNLDVGETSNWVANGYKKSSSAFRNWGLADLTAIEWGDATAIFIVIPHRHRAGYILQPQNLEEWMQMSKDYGNIPIFVYSRRSRVTYVIQNGFEIVEVNIDD